VERPRSLFSSLFAPFRFAAGEVFLWEDRDVWLYFILAVFLVMIYIGSYHIWIAPMGIIFPLLGPKSRAARYLRALQEDLRLTQGKMVEKKGGVEPVAITDGKIIGLNWPMAIYIGGSHVMALYALMVFTLFKGVCPMGMSRDGQAMKWETVAFAFFLYVCGGLGITAGVHRLWSHRSYKAAFPLRFVLMIFNSIANQGTIIHWSRDHRLHHKYSDTIADPHDANRGFWFSHVGWLLVKKRPEVRAAGKEVKMDDIYADQLCVLQKKMDPFWNLLWCFGLPSYMALLWGDSMWNGFLIGGVLRYAILLNATWCVNSVVHHWGAKPYNASHLTTENGWVSFISMGEGWHNWHHAFPWDYAAAELEPLLQFNPTKIFLDCMCFLGLAWDMKRADKAWAQRKARWEETNGRKVIESLEGPPLFKKRITTFGPEEYGGEETVKITGEEEPCEQQKSSVKCD
jgi:stearoyl-CoA desaturase (delta-9 desaturase)